jgi:ParB family chromosome partitioning protein
MKTRIYFRRAVWDFRVKSISQKLFLSAWQILTVDDIKAERIEIAENLFRVDLTTLERGQQYKRLKDLYEAEHPQTKKGGDKQTEEAREKLKTESVFSFVKDTATKTNKSETTIKEEVQVATNIPEKVQAVIKDLPVADNKICLL